MIFLSIPGISSCFQAKTSQFALKKEIISSFSRVGSVDPISRRKHLSFPSRRKSSPLSLELGVLISTSCGVSDGSGMGSSSLITHVWFSPDVKVA